MMNLRLFNTHYFYGMFLFFCCISLKLEATHIVGGEIGYRCLGNDQYEIRLRVFRDCDTGVPWFDNPAAVGVFDSNDSLIFDLRLMMRENDTLDLNLTDPCLVAPPNVCIHTTSYIDTVSLPFQPGGYQLVYQRCCRNQDIVNIVNPLGTGATFYCLITEEALLNCNSSAEFNNWPPVYICAGVPIYFDHSATDSDGDSLVYRMCTPLDGASTSDPMPQPPYNPPYNQVNWLSPTFSVDNMLGGPDSLRIDQSSGLLEGTPSLLGVFVVGICVEEYRNGQLISTSRRDFQYAVGTCGQLVSSAFFAPQIQCDNSLLVQFQNNSQSLGTGYVWYFGDSTNNVSSSLENPIYIYPDTGTYNITLIADPGSLCADTTTQEINLQYESILMDFSLMTSACSDSITVVVSDLTVDTISNIISWNWDFGNGTTDSVPFASTVYSSSGTYIISLEVEAANGCTAIHTDTIVLDLPAILSPDSVALCPGAGPVTLNPGGNPNHQYQWSPASGLSDPSAPSPTANPTQSTTYQVTVTAFNGLDSCVLQKAVHVFLPPPIQLDPIPDTASCNDTVYYVIDSSQNLSYEWSYLPNFYPLQSSSNPAMIQVPPAPSFINLYFRATDEYGCQYLDTALVQGQDIPVVADFSLDYLSCGEELLVQFTDLSQDSSQGPIIAWNWDFGNGQSSTSQNPLVNYTTNGPFVIDLEITSLLGCTGTASDTILNLTLPLMAGPDTLGICSGTNSVQLNAGGDTSLSYQWSPSTGLSDPTAASPVASPSVPTTYTVTITAINDSDTCINVDTVFVGFPAPISVQVDNQNFCGTQVTLTANSTTAVVYEWSGDPTFNTIVTTGNPVTITPQTFPFSGYYVRATDAYGCTASDFSLLQQVNTAVNASFSWAAGPCNDSLDIQFTNTTTDTTGTTIASVLWTSSDGQSSSDLQPVFTFTASGTYIITLSVQLANNCSGVVSDTLDLNIASLPGPSVLGLCGNESSIPLNQGGDSTGMSYQWSPATGLSDPLSYNPIATPPSIPFTYTVTVTANNSFGNCSQVHQVTVVDPPPIWVNLPADTTFCFSPYLLQAMPSSTTVLLEWSLIPDFSSVILPNVNPVLFSFGSSNTTYTMYVRVTDQYGCTAVDTSVLNYSVDPVNVDFLAVPQGCNPDSLFVQFTDLTSDTSTAPIQSWYWDFGNNNYSTAQNPLFAYGAADTTHHFSLTVLLNNNCSGTLSDSILYQLPDFNGPDSIGLCGDTLPLLLNPGGNPDLIYQWAPAAGLSATNVASPLLFPSGNQIYTVTITAPNNGDTCVAIQTFSVFADSFDFEPMPDTLICADQLELYVNSTSATFVEWALDRDFNLILGYGNPLFTNIHNDQWFYVRGRNAFGCEAMDSVFIAVKKTPIAVDFELNLQDCQNSLEVQFFDFTADTLNNTLTGWIWDFGTGDSSTLQNPVYTYPQNGVFNPSLTVITENGCSGSQALPLSLNLPVLQNNGDTLLSCAGVPVPLNPNADTSLLYQWSPASGLSDPNSPNPIAFNSGEQTYTVTITAVNQLGNQLDSCVQVQSLTLFQAPLLTLELNADSIACSDTVFLAASSNFGQSYIWSSSPDFTIPFSTQSTAYNIQSNPSQTYYVEVTDSFGCSVRDSITIFQHQIQAIMDSVAVVCPDQPAVLTVTNLITGDLLTYYWSPDSLLLSGQGTATISTAAEQPADFTVFLSNQYGCTDSLSAFVNVSNSSPPLDISVSEDSIFIGETIQLLATEDAGYQYEWLQDPSLSDVDIFNPYANPQVNTLYQLSITDALGCQNEDSIMIYIKTFVCEEPYVFVPNTFTPNQDGLNDVLYVRGNVITELYFAVYNRWGEKLFETSDQQIGWDGTFKGQELPPDAYGYYLRYKCVGQGASDEFQFKKGNVTIIR